MTSLLDVWVTVKPDMDKFGPEVKKKLARIDAGKEGKQVATRFGVGLNGGIASAVSKSAGIFAAGFAALKVGGFLKGAISQASDLSESASKVNVVFKKASKQILETGKISASSMGLSESAYLAATGTLGNLLVSLDLAPTKAAAMSQEMVKLAGDLASFNNVSPDEALEALKSGLTGEAEPLKRFGVNMNDATLKAQALKLGLIKNTKEALTPQAKALAAQALIMAQTKTAQGDFARTSGGLANQQRILSARFADVKTSIGAVALPLATKFFGFLNDKAIPALSGVASGITTFVQSKSFQTFLADVGDKAKDVFGFLQSEALPRLKDFAGFVKDDAAPALAGFASNMKDTLGPAVKDVFGFVKDEVLPRLKEFGDFLGDKVVPKVGELADKLSKNQDFLVPFAGTLLAIVAGLKAWAFIQAALNLILAANPIGLIVVAIAALVGGLIWAYKNSDTFKKVVDTAFKVVKASAVLMWDKYLKPMFELFVDILKGVWETAQDFARNVSAAWGAIKEPARIAIKYVTDYFLGFVDDVLTGASKAFGWVPGLGPKLKTAAAEFGKFRDAVNKKLDGINDQSINVELKYSSKGVNLTAPSSVGRGMADGGGVFGGTRGKDSVPALLMPDEHVWTTDETHAVGGHGAMKRLRQAALAGELKGFANGGSPGLSVNPKLPSAQGLANEVASHKALLVKPYLARLAKALDGGVGGPPGAIQSFRGVKLNTRTIRMLGNAERMLGAMFHITQGSYSTRVAASGSTHAGGGAMDTNGPRGWGRAVTALRAAGFAAWHRTPSMGPWGHHIHSIALGDTSASAAAKAQMASFRRGGDGLGHGASSKASASSGGYNTAKMKFGAGGGVTKKMARDMGMQIFDNGGKWRSGTIAANTSGKTETVTAGGDTMTVRLSDEDRALLRDVRAKVYLDSRELSDGMSRHAMGRGY